MSEMIAISNLKPGMVILRITQQNGPVKIRKSGLVTSEDMIRGLSEMGVSEVEIDPEQTVELESETDSVSGSTTTTTQTQALLRGQYDRQGHYDNQLADQFNRNLFLPSVQGIPSMWMVYLRQFVVIALTIVIGVVIGFGGATYSIWLPDKQAHEEVVQLPAEEPAVVTQESAESNQNEDTVIVQNAEVVQEPALDEREPEPAPEPEPSAISAEEEGVPLMAQQDTDTSQVSPELLRRFNRAIEQLDNEQTEPLPERNVVVRDQNDVQRIDQLPVRLMTTLPTMTFSAHMYASRPNDRWVRVNNLRLQEGDWIDNEVQIINIEPQHVILEYRGEVFSMAALTDW